MSRRLLVAIATAVAATALLAPPADAHPAERFTACAATSATTPRCDRLGTTFDAGRTVYLRGRISPAHPGFGQVWRRAPYSSRWEQVGLMGVSEQGRIRWSWVTDEDDAVASAPYTFQFRVPRHGRSWAAKVWVVER
jgi:hypothetical protein